MKVFKEKKKNEAMQIFKTKREEIKEGKAGKFVKESLKGKGYNKQKQALSPRESERKGFPERAPSPQPDATTESVKDAVYKEIKGKPFIKKEGDELDIHPNDVSQGRLGDCYFVAALAAIAKHSPDTIRQRVKDNGDGTYTVKFHEGGDVVVDTQFPTKGGRPVYAEPGDKSEEGVELWVMLIEKAWAVLKGGYEQIRGSKVQMKSKDMMQAITGKETRIIYPVSMNEDELIEILADAMQKGYPVTMGVYNFKKEEEIKMAREAGVVPNHAYALMKVDKKGKTIELYNPWGKEYKVPLLDMKKVKNVFQTININKD